MTVDIIIPTYKPDETLCLLLQRLREQTFVVHRVIILNTEEVLWKEALAHYPVEKALKELNCPYDIIHIAKKDFDHGGTRQLGADYSKADILLFMTQDAVPADIHLTEYLVKAFRGNGDNSGNAPEVAVAYARQLPRADCYITERYTRQFNYPDKSCIKTKADIPSLGIKTFFCSDVCAAYRADIFHKLGGFTSPVIFNEDMLFAAKAVMSGYSVAYAAEAQVVHSHNYTVRQQFKRNFDLAVSQKQHPEVFEQVSSEKEGMRMVKNTVKYLCGIRRPWLIVPFFMQCAGKYAGYRLGKHYEKLSEKQILKCTMNTGYWNIRKDVHE